jgi:hypothetical protein
MPKRKNPETVAFREEVSPIVRHAAVVGILMAAFIAIGFMFLGLEKLFPKFKTVFEFLEKVDIGLLALLFCFFALYTVVIVVVRLWRGTVREVKGAESTQATEAKKA